MSTPVFGQITTPADYNRAMEVHVGVSEADNQILRDLYRCSGCQPLNVLEYGSGAGRFSFKLVPLVKRGIIRLTTVDHDRVFVRFAEGLLAQHDINVVCADILTHQPDNPVDVACAQGVFHHLSNDEGLLLRCLQRIRDTLSHDGVGIFSDELLRRYRGPNARRLYAILWYAYVLDQALCRSDVNTYLLLASEESRTMLDDIPQLAGAKSEEQIQYFRSEVPTLARCILQDGSRYALTPDALRHANRVYRELLHLKPPHPSGNPALDQCRGDQKIDEARLEQMFRAAGFRIKKKTRQPTLDVCGGFAVYVVSKR